ncbi:phage tail protein [Xenorhabdus nematophila]|uniref:phage tail-collar fiber domain-containing protein n=1 Tax=Xenorhabdus nematophila TaxID=628 RepID=UPI0032B73E60
MSSVITLDFEKWKAQQVAVGNPVVLDEFVFAYVPDLDPSQGINRSEKLPADNHIVHRQAVNKTGLASENAVAYSVTLGTEVGHFDFNWIGLMNKTSGVIGMITHAPTQKKIKTANGLQGNVLTRSFLLEFAGAAKETAITTTAETWQIDFTARLSGIDEMQRLMNTDSYGDAAFFGDGFAVIRRGDQYTVKKGLAYVGGLRGALEFDQTLNSLRNTRVYADFSYQGNLVSQWKTAVKITAANDLKNYVDVAGYPHYVFTIARIDGDGNITDLRNRGTLSDRDIAVLQKELDRVKQSYVTQQALKKGLDGKQPKGDYADKSAPNKQEFTSFVSSLQGVEAGDGDNLIGIYARNGRSYFTARRNGRWIGDVEYPNRGGVMALQGESYTKHESDDRYQPVGNYADKSSDNAQMFNSYISSLKGMEVRDANGNRIGMFTNNGEAYFSFDINNTWIGDLALPKQLLGKRGVIATIDDVKNNGVPIGGTIAWHSTRIPPNYLPRDGRSFNVSDHPELAKIYPAGRLPDDSALYYRMVDNGRGIDSGRQLDTERMDSLPAIRGSIANGVARGESAPEGVFYLNGRGDGVEYSSAGVNRFYSTFGFDVSRVFRTNTDKEIKVRDRAVIWITRAK